MRSMRQGARTIGTTATSSMPCLRRHASSFALIVDFPDPGVPAKATITLCVSLCSRRIWIIRSISMAICTSALPPGMSMIVFCMLNSCPFSQKANASFSLLSNTFERHTASALVGVTHRTTVLSLAPLCTDQSLRTFVDDLLSLNTILLKSIQIQGHC